MKEETATATPEIPRSHDGKPVTTLNLAISTAAQIAAEELALYDLVIDAATVSEQIAARESDIYEKVCAEKEGDKPKYGNDGARKAAAANRASTDDTLLVLRKEHQTKARDIAIKRQRISYYQNCVNIYRNYLRGYTDNTAG